jgi:hypothetical protein
MTPREECLSAALEAVTATRNEIYGNPNQNFEDIARLWDIYLCGRTRAYYGPEAVPEEGLIGPEDVAPMMILMKTSRLINTVDHKDSLIDIAGYAACAYDVISHDAS